ncbi:MAG: hypothetical protein R3B90_22095 [Planctomycetaceae bacterium]
MPEVLDQLQVGQSVEHASFQNSLGSAEAEFGYRPVPMSAMLGAALAVLSLSALVTWMAIPVAFVATVVSLIAMVRIVRSKASSPANGWRRARWPWGS